MVADVVADADVVAAKCNGHRGCSRRAVLFAVHKGEGGSVLGSANGYTWFIILVVLGLFSDLFSFVREPFVRSIVAFASHACNATACL